MMSFKRDGNAAIKFRVNAVVHYKEKTAEKMFYIIAGGWCDAVDKAQDVLAIAFADPKVEGVELRQLTKIGKFGPEEDEIEP